MECNKDEAIRAMELAEKMMEKTDFEGARRLALKSRNLFPELENINRMLSTCDVHCSAKKLLIGSEKNWYEILQVDKFADVSMVKKQYRRLALILHPDKNRFPGAEGAFKLICEANMVLSDPIKKSLFDGKLRASAFVSAPPNPLLNKQYNAGNNVTNCSAHMSQHQAAKSSSSSNLDVFWTSCPYCKMRYQYPRQFVQRTISCPDCKMIFEAYEVKVPDDPSRTKSSTQGAAQNVHEKFAANTGSCKTGIQNSTLQDKSQVATGRENVNPEKDTRSEDIKVASAADNVKISMMNEQETAYGDTSYKEMRELKSRTRKRVRKKSSESCDASTGSDFEDLTSTDQVATELKFESVQVQPPRRSSRKKEHVSYDETEVDLTDTKENNVSKNPKNGYQNSFPGDASCLEGISPAEDTESDKNLKMRGETQGKSCDDVDVVEIESDWDEDTWDEDTCSSDVSNIECLDPEFGDFDKEREEGQFEIGQFWACYDSLDNMPRFYAKVKKVCYSPFELIITWLEAVPIHELCKEWVDNELPVGCGSFKLAHTEKAARLSFSHQVHVEKRKTRGPLLLYPRKGEVWAIFKDWDISCWSANPNNHKKNFKYEIVEVLSDFAAGYGIKVAYLAQIAGFVSLFQRAFEGEKGSFVIDPNEVYRFSHRVPCFVMTGLEREGVPKGAFELDPASLPLNPDDLFYPGK